MEGTVLLLTDVEPNELACDQRFYHIVRSRYRFLVSKTPFKLTVGSCVSAFWVVTCLHVG